MSIQTGNKKLVYLIIYILTLIHISLWVGVNYKAIKANEFFPHIHNVFLVLIFTSIVLMVWWIFMLVNSTQKANPDCKKIFTIMREIQLDLGSGNLEGLGMNLDRIFCIVEISLMRGDIPEEYAYLSNLYPNVDMDYEIRGEELPLIKRDLMVLANGIRASQAVS